MNITFNIIGKETAEDLFDLDDMFKGDELSEADMVNRLRWRIKALARINGVPEDYVQWDLVEYQDWDGVVHDITPIGDALYWHREAVQFYLWSMNKRDFEVLPIVARMYTDSWKYLNFGDLEREVEACYHQFDGGDYEEFARSLVDDGVLDGPGEEWEWYIDWEQKGQDLANDYTQYDYQGITYLFGN